MIIISLDEAQQSVDQIIRQLYENFRLDRPPPFFQSSLESLTTHQVDFLKNMGIDYQASLNRIVLQDSYNSFAKRPIYRLYDLYKVNIVYKCQNESLQQEAKALILNVLKRYLSDDYNGRVTELVELKCSFLIELNNNISRFSSPNRAMSFHDCIHVAAKQVNPAVISPGVTSSTVSDLLKQIRALDARVVNVCTTTSVPTNASYMSSFIMPVGCSIDAAQASTNSIGHQKSKSARLGRASKGNRADLMNLAMGFHNEL